MLRADRQARDRRRAFLLPAGLFLLPVLLAAAPNAPAGERPNLVLVSFCSIRADHLGCYGYGRDTSPALDAFARDAVLFEAAVTPWPKTSPSFCSIMTGTYPHTDGVLWKTAGVRLADDRLTLAEILRDAGYATAAFVSSGALSPRLNIQQGFDVYEETWKKSPARSYPLEVRYDRTARRALAWLDGRPASPFFLWVHFNNAHYPYKAPDAIAAPFLGDSLYADTLRPAIGRGAIRAIEIPAGHPNAAQVLHNDLGVIPERGALPLRPGVHEYHRDLAYYIAHYDAGIRWADRSAAIFLDGLRARGLLDRAVIVLAGDHGESLGEHGFYFEHGRFPYENCLHVPLMIRDPSHPPGRVPSPVGVFGILPTLLDLAGIEIPPSIESPSLLSLLDGDDGPRRVFSESGYEVDFQAMIREGRWKLIHVPNGRDRAIMAGAEFELYDLAADPGETENLCDLRPEILAPLRKELLRWSGTWRGTIEALYAPENLGVDSATLENLRSMGYVK